MIYLIYKNIKIQNTYGKTRRKTISWSLWWIYSENEYNEVTKDLLYIIDRKYEENYQNTYGDRQYSKHLRKSGRNKEAEELETKLEANNKYRDNLIHFQHRSLKKSKSVTQEETLDFEG